MFHKCASSSCRPNLEAAGFNLGQVLNLSSAYGIFAYGSYGFAGSVDPSAPVIGKLRAEDELSPKPYGGGEKREFSAKAILRLSQQVRFS